MAHILLVRGDSHTFPALQHSLARHASASVSDVAAESVGIFLTGHVVDLACITARDSAVGLASRNNVRRARPMLATILILEAPTTSAVVAAMKLGAGDVLDGVQLTSDGLTEAIDLAMGRCTHQAACRIDHAAARWANAVVGVIDAPHDPRTVEGWAGLISIAPGTLKNWCSTAGVPPRRSALLARLVRAVNLSGDCRRAPETFLNVVDKRTLAAIRLCAGLSDCSSWPNDVHHFLETQTLVRDHSLLLEVGRALESLPHTHPRGFSTRRFIEASSDSPG